MTVTFWLSPPLRTWAVVLPDTATEDDVWREWTRQTRGVWAWGGWDA
jgi:hypothetical protein